MENSGRSGNGRLHVLKEIWRDQLERAIPARGILLRTLHALTLAVLSLQIATGILLMVDYRPSSASAFPSVVAILDQAYFGWLFHAIHGWGTHLLLLLVLASLAASYFQRAYRGPRAFDWSANLLLLLCLLGFAFTGALLPWDQHAYWSTESLLNALSRVPLFGAVTFALLSPQTEIGEETLLRFYVVHVGFLPWITVLLLGFRFWVTRRSDRPFGFPLRGDVGGGVVSRLPSGREDRVRAKRPREGIRLHGLPRG